MRVAAREEHDLVTRVLLAHGAPGEQAALQASWLVEADLRGQSSHGIRRLAMLVERMRSGLVAAGSTGTVSRQSPSLLLVDGGQGFGPVVGSRAVAEAMAAVAGQGIVLAAVRNANHLGILAPYVEAMADEGLVGLALTTSEALVHPFGGRFKLIGTNPIAIAVPAKPHPFVLDMATGAVSMGRILHHLETGEPLQPGWAVDGRGEPTTDPGAAAAGAIDPFGGAKGYALGLAFEVLVATLTATALGEDVRGTLDAEAPSNKGDVFVCIDPAALHGGDQVAAISRYLEAVRESAPQDGADRVRVPGDRSRAERARREAAGVEIAEPVWRRACELAEEAGVAP